MPMGPNQLVARLKEATDHLIDSARQVARPGWVWIVGILYPGITVNLNFEELLQLAGELGEVTPEEVAEESAGVRELVGELAQREDLQLSLLGIGGSFIALILLGIPVVLTLSRLYAGLASTASADSWRRTGDPSKVPSLGQVWVSGGGMSWSSFGVSVLLGLMRVIALLLLVGVPALFFQGVLRDGVFEDRGVLFTITYLPLAGVLILYSLVLGSLHQLALHSLVENRRGMTSALRHAWRLLRVETQQSVSFLVIELCCALIGTLAIMGVYLGATVLCLLTPAALFIHLALLGFAGVLRAAFWSRAYRQMGGATSSDPLGGIGATPSQS